MESLGRVSGPASSGSQRLGRFLLEEPGLGPRGAEVGHPGNRPLCLGDRAGRELIAGAGWAGEGAPGAKRHLTALRAPRNPPLGGGPANPLLERKLIAAAREGRIKASVDPHPPGLESWYLLLN